MLLTSIKQALIIYKCTLNIIKREPLYNEHSSTTAHHYHLSVLQSCQALHKQIARDSLHSKKDAEGNRKEKRSDAPKVTWQISSRAGSRPDTSQEYSAPSTEPHCLTLPSASAQVTVQIKHTALLHSLSQVHCPFTLSLQLI